MMIMLMHNRQSMVNSHLLFQCLIVQTVSATPVVFGSFGYQPKSLMQSSIVRNDPTFT